MISRSFEAAELSTPRVVDMFRVFPMQFQVCTAQGIFRMIIPVDHPFMHDTSAQKTLPYGRFLCTE